jgi:glycosyltransferase involved in cell wall biosynthesis
MKRALLVSYHYPPDAAVGAIRVAELAQHLKRHNINPTVLTVKQESYDRVDSSKPKHLGDKDVLRTACWKPPLLQARAALKQLCAPKRHSCETDSPSPTNSHVNGSASLKTSGLRRLFMTLNYFPDDKIFWLLPGLFRGFLATRRHKFDYIIASSPPHSVAVIAYILSRISGIPLILDYRDPWTVKHSPWTFPHRLETANRLERRLERQIIQHASLVVLNTDEYREQLVSSKLVHPNKLLTVYNGFDASVRQVHPAPCKKGITIAHFGTLYMDRNPANFFRALDLLLDREPQLMQDLSIEFFGSNLLDVENALANRRCRAIVRLNAPIPYAEAIRRMAAADILLAFAQNQPFQIPAKLFDYIAQKRAILLLGSEGASFNLIRKINAGLCASLNEEQDILAALEKLVVERGFQSFEDYDNSAFTRDVQFDQLMDRMLAES